MKLRFLAKESTPKNSPTLYATDRQRFVIQGWKVTDPEILAKLDIPEGETVVEVPAQLLTHLDKDGLHGTVTSWRPPIVHVKGNGNYIIQGPRVTDPAVLAQMDVPDNEDAIQVSRAAIAALLGGG